MKLRRLEENLDFPIFGFQSPGLIIFAPWPRYLLKIEIKKAPPNPTQFLPGSSNLHNMATADKVSLFMPPRPLMWQLLITDKVNEEHACLQAAAKWSSDARWSLRTARSTLGPISSSSILGSRPLDDFLSATL